jgi:hypothetical protein
VFTGYKVAKFDKKKMGKKGRVKRAKNGDSDRKS